MQRSLLVPAVIALSLLAGPAAAEGLDGLSWLQGCWGKDEGGDSTEECWLPAKGGLMLGVHRDVYRSGKVFFEFLRIEAAEGGLAYVVNPMGRAATTFRLETLEAKRVVFENPQHDFPQRIIYRLDGDGTLHARIEGVQDGKRQGSEWQWRRRSGF